MESKDYEINMLLRIRNRYKHDGAKQDYAYYYTRNIITYMGRLVFAVGWSKIRDSAPAAVNRNLYAKLFKNLSETQSIEPGRLAKILEDSAEKSKVPADLVAPEIATLERLGSNRNIQSHDDAKVNFSSYFKETDSTFEEFEKMFEGKECSYIVPLRQENQECVCYKFDSGSDFGEEIAIPKAAIPYKDQQGNRLFYQVTDQHTANSEYYCLSPFIEKPEFIFEDHPHFRVYSHMENSGYGSDCITLQYRAVKPSFRVEKGQVSADYSRSTAAYRRSDLFAHQYGDSDADKSKWFRSQLDNVYINTSSYPGFGSDILNCGYSYFPDICPVRKDVISFCQDENRQMAQVTGNGGLGKTALMLSIIYELSGNRDKYRFSNLIFLSAKKSFFSIGQTSGSHVSDGDPDIHGFSDLVTKLADLLEIEYSPQPETLELADRIVESTKSQTGSHKKFLLIIDDLDSLPPDDQEKIWEYIFRFDPKFLKTLITTRDYAQNSPVSFQLQELVDEQSLKFARWYVENKMELPSWTAWSRRKTAQEWILQFGEGNPLTIQMLLVLVRAGAEKTFHSPATRNERIAYMYNTADNLLTDDEKCIFYICRRLYAALPEDKREQEMLLVFLEYLAAGCGIGKEDFEKAAKRLDALKLITFSRNDKQFRPFVIFILSDDMLRLSKPNIPKMYEMVWKDVSKRPEKWLTIGDAADVITSLIVENEGRADFDNVVSMQIFEYMLTNKAPLTPDLRREIESWRDKHAVVMGQSQDNKDEFSNRLIQRIENTWTRIKKLIDEDQDPNDLGSQLQNDIQSLNAALRNNKNDAISVRLERVKGEMPDYGY